MADTPEARKILSVPDADPDRPSVITPPVDADAIAAPPPPGTVPQPSVPAPSLPDSTGLVEHCRLAHFTLFSLCVGMLIALNADPDRRLTETIDELDHVKLLQAHWQDLSALVTNVVVRDQKQGTKFELFGTVMLDGSPMDVTANLDLQGLWIPYHSHLYNKAEPLGHFNRLSQPGTSTISLSNAWDWATDLQWIFVPTAPVPLLNIGRVELKTRQVLVEQTVRTQLQQVVKFPQDQHRGQSKRLLMFDMVYNDGTGLPFGPFPRQYASEPNMGHVTIYGSGGGVPSLQSQVVAEMHVDATVVRPRSFLRGDNRVLFEPDQIRSVTVKIPIHGRAENVAPLSALGRALGIPIVAAEKFSNRFPRTAALSQVYRELPVQQARQVLDEQRTQLTQKSLSVAGLDIPLTFVVRWGQLIVIVVFAYFLVNGYELTRRLAARPPDKGWEAAWIAVYQGVPGRIMAIISGFLLPLGIGLLSARRVLGTSGGQDKAIALSSAVVLVALSVLALVLFNRLARLPKPR